MDIIKLMQLMVEKGASDLHLKVPSSPVLRIDGELVPLVELANATPQFTRESFEQLATDQQRQLFSKQLEIDFAYSIAGLARFRVSAFYQRGTISIAIRQLSLHIPTIAELGLPSICESLAIRPSGLVLIVGPTGSGKSTTLAAMINHLNQRMSKHVITIEDPIEYVYADEKCLIAQRDLGDDTRSFADALKSSLRQDPDVILVGEMRDLDTISAAITAAETGHMVFSTVHTNNAHETIERLIDVFQPYQQQQIRFQLSQILQAVLSQRLLPRAGGKGRIAAFEIMICTDAIRNLIKEAKTDQIPSYIQTGAQDGMKTLDQALQELIAQGMVTMERCQEISSQPDKVLTATRLPITKHYISN